MFEESAGELAVLVHLHKRGGDTLKMNLDEQFMREAISEALKGDPALTSPNPRVGSVIVEDGAIVARAYFAKDGEPHAERRAIAALGRKPSDSAVIYVTLEPCSTEGRTGSCSRAIIEIGFRRVVVGALDPTPEHSGNGLKILADAGIEVVSGVLEDECLGINPGFAGNSTGAER